MEKVKKLNINATDTGVNFDVDGAPEGIHIEYEILPEVIAAIVQEIPAEILGAPAATTWAELPGRFKRDYPAL